MGAEVVVQRRAALVPAAAPLFAQDKACASIKAADGSCVDPGLVATANKRAAIVSSQFTSYLGTPMGSVTTPFIPQERLFRDDQTLYGLPTNTTITGDAPNITTKRSK